MGIAAFIAMKIIRPALSTLIVLLIALPLSSAMAGELHGIINGKSFHVGATEDWNENNYGLGLEYQFDTQSRWKTQLMANALVDSNEDMSYMVGGGVHRNLIATDRLHGFYLDAGINVFLMTRTDVNDNQPFPGALPSIAVGNRYVGFNLAYLPAKAVEKFYSAEFLDETTTGIVFLQMKVNISQLLNID